MIKYPGVTIKFRTPLHFYFITGIKDYELNTVWPRPLIDTITRFKLLKFDIYTAKMGEDEKFEMVVRRMCSVTPRKCTIKSKTNKLRGMV